MSNKIYDMSDTWNDANQTFTAVKMKVDDLNSLNNSMLMDLSINGSSKFSIDKNGNVVASGSWNGSVNLNAPIPLGNVSGVIPLSTISYTQNAIYELTATGDINFPDPVDFIPGAQIDIFVTQDSIGSHAITFGSGGVPTNFLTRIGDALSTTPGTTDIVSISVTNSGKFIVRISNGIVAAPVGVTYTTSSFTVPTPGSSVVVSVANGTSYQNGSYIFIPGSPSMYGIVTSGGGTNSLTITRIYSGSSSSGNTIQAGTLVGFSGYPGVNGTNGAKGADCFGNVTGFPVAFSGNGATTTISVDDVRSFNTGSYAQFIDATGSSPYVVGYILITNVIFSGNYPAGILTVTNISCGTINYSSGSIVLQPCGGIGPQGNTGPQGNIGPNGHGSTTTTSSANIAPNIVLSVVDNTAFPSGSWVYATNGTYWVQGKVTSVSGTNSISISTYYAVGSTLPSGAAVTFSGIQGPTGQAAYATLGSAISFTANGQTATVTVSNTAAAIFASGVYAMVIDNSAAAYGPSAPFVAGFIQVNSQSGVYNQYLNITNISCGAYSTGSNYTYVTLQPCGGIGPQGPQGIQGPAGTGGGGAPRLGTVSNHASASKLLDFTTYKMPDSTAAVVINASAMSSKTIASNWSAGASGGLLDTGSVAANTTYHIYAICKSDLSGGDFICSLNAMSPAMPSGYSGGYYVRIASLYTDASSNWVMFTQRFNLFILATPVHELNGSASSTTATTKTLSSVPTGVRVKPRTKWNGGAVNTAIGSMDDIMTSASSFNSNYGYDTTGANGVAEPDILTNTSGQIQYISSGAGGTVSCWSYGWEDIGLLWGV